MIVPHVLPVQRPGNVAGNESIDNLDILDHLAVLKLFQGRGVQSPGHPGLYQEDPGHDFGDEVTIRVLFGILAVEAVFILDKEYCF